MTLAEQKKKAQAALRAAEHELDELLQKVSPKFRRLVKHHLTSIRSIQLEIRNVVLMPREIEDSTLHAIEDDSL